MGEDDEAARVERARKLRAEIDELGKGRRRPRSPSEFIEEEMRDRAAHDDGDEDDGGDDPK